MKLKSEFEVKKIGKETVLISVNENRVDLSCAFSLNPTAKYLIGFLKKGSTKTEMVAAFSKKYELSKSKAGKDVSAFLKEMTENGFIE